MIQLLIALAIVAILYFTVLGGDKTVDEAVEETAEAMYQETHGVYQHQAARVKGLEQSMQQSADQKMQRIDQRSGGDY